MEGTQGDAGTEGEEPFPESSVNCGEPCGSVGAWWDCSCTPGTKGAFVCGASRRGLRGSVPVAGSSRLEGTFCYDDGPHMLTLALAASLQLACQTHVETRDVSPSSPVPRP